MVRPLVAELPYHAHVNICCNTQALTIYIIIHHPCCWHILSTSFALFGNMIRVIYCNNNTILHHLETLSALSALCGPCLTLPGPYYDCSCCVHNGSDIVIWKCQMSPETWAVAGKIVTCQVVPVCTENLAWSNKKISTPLLSRAQLRHKCRTVCRG